MLDYVVKEPKKSHIPYWYICQPKCRGAVRSPMVGNGVARIEWHPEWKESRMRIVLAAALWLAIAQPALCGPLTDFLALHDEPLGRDQTETQIMGIQHGFIAANAYLTGTLKQPPMYCQPETLSLTADQLIEMLRRGVKEQPELDADDPPSALLAVMQHTFPCAQNSKVGATQR
jgi:hypothetical protein